MVPEVTDCLLKEYIYIYIHFHSTTTKYEYQRTNLEGFRSLAGRLKKEMSEYICNIQGKKIDDWQVC